MFARSKDCTPNKLTRENMKLNNKFNKLSYDITANA